MKVAQNCQTEEMEAQNSQMEEMEALKNLVKLRRKELLKSRLSYLL